MHRFALLLLLLAACGDAKPPATPPPKPPAAAPNPWNDGTAFSSVSLALDRLICPKMCPLALKEALSGVPGVSGVDVDVSKRRVTVSGGQTPLAAQALDKAMREAGYRYRILTSRPTLAAQRYQPPAGTAHTLRVAGWQKSAACTPTGPRPLVVQRKLAALHGVAWVELDRPADKLTVICTDAGPDAPTLIDALGAMGVAAETDGARGPRPPLVTEALGKGKRVLLRFSSPTCAVCKRMKGSWSHEAVAPRLDGYTVVDVDTTRQPRVALHFRVSGVPAVVRLAGDGRETGRLDGYHDARALRRFLSTDG